MKLEEIKKILDSTGLQVAYRQWEKGKVPNLPYIIYYQENTDNFTADNHVFHKGIRVSIELYSNLKNILAEEAIEKIFDENKIEWEASETYIESERMYLVLYETTI
ncbi:hypothetical protein [Enterococcus sp. BWR-S5]|uniref:hypothetical protein n=1 Tax=Enterococcus sp. BWR-S5 TaxID=2787714 RepID=UPI001924E686|nr:hypothetical protein [Enterococcus sp. BWR-S5]MBL1226605.1 hypothetical protein [Enterococcus sp. BWR-S5]